MKLLTKNLYGPSSDLYQNQLDNLSLKKEELQDELEFLKEEKENAEARSPIGTKSYQKILKPIIDKWEAGNTDDRENLVKAMVHRVVSNVDRDSSGTIEVDYIADKQPGS